MHPALALHSFAAHSQEFAMAPGPDGRAGITLDRFLSLWTLLALDNPRLAVEYFACLGYRTFAEHAGPASSAASAIAGAPVP